MFYAASVYLPRWTLSLTQGALAAGNERRA